MNWRRGWKAIVKTFGRLNAVYALYVLLGCAFLAFLHSAYFLTTHDSLRGEAELVRSLTWILALFTLVVGALAIALWRWGMLVALERSEGIRMRRLFSVLNHLQDALVAADDQGRMLGCNLSARRVINGHVESGKLLHEVFDFLSEEDATRLIDRSQPAELIRNRMNGARDITFRIRSYPSDDMTLVVMSDVTRQQRRAAVEEKEAELQLIGRIAQGVAHDFNNILCAISGHADLISRMSKLPQVEADSLTTIAEEANRGAILARQLVDLSRSEEYRDDDTDIGNTIQRSANMLKKALCDGWQVVADTVNTSICPPMPSNQLEQVVIRFGLQLADEYESPGTLHLLVRPPAEKHLQDVGADHDAVMFLVVTEASAAPSLEAYELDTAPPRSKDGGGAVQSVALSLLEHYGGSLDVLRHASAHRGYRIRLLRREVRPPSTDVNHVDAIRDIVGWRILLVQPVVHDRNEARDVLESLGANVTRVNNIVAAFSRLEKGERFHAILMEESLLGMNPLGAVRKVVRHQPEVPLVVMASNRLTPGPLAEHVAHISFPLSQANVRLGLSAARRLAYRRTAHLVTSH